MKKIIAIIITMMFALIIPNTGFLCAHEIKFNSSMTYSATQPTGDANSIANWTGAAFDANNIGGSGVNADGGDDNGMANDEYTYVANNQPVQGQTFLTGSAPNGYQLNTITVRMAGYINNIATGTNQVYWNLHEQNGPIILTINEINGTTRTTMTRQIFTAGDVNNPGSGNSANGPGTYITFHLPFTTYLEPNKIYGFELRVGNGSANYFEWLGTSDDTYASGTAYHYSGSTITPLSGDHVFMADMTALSSPPVGFVHPGTLHRQADLDRMVAKVAANEEPWLSGYNMLLSSPYNNLGWPAYDVDYIIRGGTGNNYTRSQQDAQLIYTLTLIWHLTGNTAYADRAVYIANVWSDLVGIQGDTNASLAAGICGYLFAISGELLSTYPGWPEAEKQAYKDMMMRVFYPANFDFLWRHHDTFITKGGNTHYRMNWDTANMASMAAIGVLCDNRAVYEQALDYFKYGPGNGRIERAAWYIHPDGQAQTEEHGRDQGHNMLTLYQMALLCQMAYNQGDDLFAYDNNRILRAWEHSTKYNLGYTTPYVWHRNCDLTYTEGQWGCCVLHFFHELVYNHYVNIKGMAAPYNQEAAEIMRPERWPNTSYHPSEVDWFGLGTLTFSLDPIPSGATPRGLQANWSENQIVLNWWGSAYATSYNIKRSTTQGGPYMTIGTAEPLDTTFTDPNVANGMTYYYVVSANNPSGESANSEELVVGQALMTYYTFEGNPDDIIGGQDGVLKGGSTGLPNYVAGFDGGQAINLDGTDDYVQLPVGIGNYQDITVAAWVNWDGGGSWQRIFDFGTEIEKYMFLTPSNGSVMRFEITTSRNADGTGLLDGPIMPTDVWTHVVVSLNGDTGTLYVDGKPVDAELIDEVDPLFGQPYCYIGRSMWNPDPLFEGSIDDFRIYNYALSGDEVWDLWGQSSNNAPVFSSDPIDTLVDEDTALADTLAPYASDADGNPMTFSKVTGPSWLNVADNGTLSGTPGNDDVGENIFVVRVTDSGGATDDATLKITVVNTNDAPFWLTDPLSKAPATKAQSYSGSLVEDADDIDVGDALVFSKTSGPDWLNVASDGTLSGTPGGGDMGENNFTVRVTDSSEEYDEATLNIIVLGSGIKTRYKFDGNANDSIGSNHGTVSGTVTYPTGQIDQAIDLDGTEDYVTLPSDLVNTDDMTISLWVYWDGGLQWQRLFDFGNNTDQYMFLTPRSDDNALRFAITTAGNGSEQIVETTQLDAGEWIHIAITLEEDVGTLYIDGLPEATNTSMSLNPSDFNPAVNYIGKSQFDDPLFNGRIDDIRIYNYALSYIDIVELAKGYGNNKPFFVSNPIVNDAGIEEMPYSGLPLSESAYDLEGDTLEFGKSLGPDWLSVESDGTLSGTPSDSDTGENEFTVYVVDPNDGSLFDIATLIIDVANIYSGVRGIEDLEGFTSQWLDSECTETPACNGADLDGDNDVDFLDFAKFANNWLAE